eukprot:1178319-Prorocentrum_minimum.AAC.2
MELGGKVRPLNFPTGPPRNPPKHPLSTPSRPLTLPLCCLPVRGASHKGRRRRDLSRPFLAAERARGARGRADPKRSESSVSRRRTRAWCARTRT